MHKRGGFFLSSNQAYDDNHPAYLETGALVRERRAKEARDNAHDSLGYITLQDGICMLPVAGVVAHLGKDRGGEV